VSHHYDLVIIGDLPAARIAGFLAARKGARVLVAPGSPPSLLPWLLPSLHLAELLKQLGGQPQSPQAPHIQVITDHCRLDINGSRPLHEELRRELPMSHQAIMNLLGDLHTRGQKLEQGLVQRLRLPLYGWRAYFSKLHPQGPGFISHIHEKISDPNALQVLNTLFGALSLAPAEELSLQEAALLWSNLQHPFRLSYAHFDQMLSRGLKKAGADLLSPMQVGAIKVSGQGPYALEFPKGPAVSATHLVVGDAELLADNPFPQQEPSNQIAFIATRLPAPRVSPLLASHIALAGPAPLRLAFEHSSDELRLQVTWSEPSQLSTEQVQARLHALMPFVPPEALDAPPTTRRQPGGNPPAFPQPACPAKASGGMWLCSGAALYPRLGFFGETLCGFAAADYLTLTLKN
jgi:hypothetical protein